MNTCQTSPFASKLNTSNTDTEKENLYGGQFVAKTNGSLIFC